ncbi:hypothetical protein [Streptomyces sp. NPDC093600]|uniref:hypothetical protein n=1 Tax=Streptomyces sp. NPDC093600 TaxID=3366047 RepID=UPI00381C2EC2
MTLDELNEQKRSEYLDTILEVAHRAHDPRTAGAAETGEPYPADRTQDPDDTYAILCDFFSRSVVFPGIFDSQDGLNHTGDVARALARLLLERLANEDLALVDAQAGAEEAG